MGAYLEQQGWRRTTFFDGWDQAGSRGWKEEERGQGAVWGVDELRSALRSALFFLAMVEQLFVLDCKGEYVSSLQRLKGRNLSPSIPPVPTSSLPESHASPRDGARADPETVLSSQASGQEPRSTDSGRSSEHRLSPSLPTESGAEVRQVCAASRKGRSCRNVSELAQPSSTERRTAARKACVASRRQVRVAVRS